MRTASRYHPALVALHWLIAVLIVGTLLLGFFGLALVSDADPAKLDRLELHMAGGMFILLLMAIRFAVRLLTARPPAAPTGRRGLDRLAPLAHYGFYVLVPLMIATGYVTGILAGLPAVVFQRTGAPIPPGLPTYPTMVAHGLIGALLTALIALQLAGAVYHQAALKDGLIGRMGLGRRVVGAKTS